MNDKTHIRTVIAKNVKRYRKLNNMTQEALAEAAEVSNTYIANIECGQTWISDRTLEKIASALCTDIYLLFISEENELSNMEAIEKNQNMISYLRSRQKQLGKYVERFFEETFTSLSQ